MSKTVSIPREPPLTGLDIVSHGRRGAGDLALSAEQIEQVSRTVRRTPEVVVKVSGGARDSGGGKAHADYIGRHGQLGLETDEGQLLSGRGTGAELVSNWNLDLSRGQYRPHGSGQKDLRPKVVHNIVLSMPGSTPAGAVLAAARDFARQNFALQYRYAMVLHTDQAHPHVHLMVKAEHEYGGPRLTIKKATLRLWREQFASALRAQGVAANATPAPLRGRATGGQKDAIFRRVRATGTDRAMPAVPSAFMRAKVERVARDLQRGQFVPRPGLERLEATREAVVLSWLDTVSALRSQGEEGLAREVERYIRQLPPVRTDDMKIADGLLARLHAMRQGTVREDPALPTEPSPRAP